MSATPCKGVKKDGAPCRGNGLEQLDGYCLAHGPTELTRGWRVRGGENSSTAARADKRLPERYRDVINTLVQGIDDVKEGSMTPAALTAIARAVDSLIDLNRVADAEMELIRAEENEAAAAAVNGSQGDLAILDTAAEYAAQQERYRIDSLVQQDMVTLQPAPEQPNGQSEVVVQPVLTAAGRRSFGYKPLTGYDQRDFDYVKDVLHNNEHDAYELSETIERIAAMGAALKKARAELELPSAPARDALTGLPLSQPPSGVDMGSLPAAPAEAEDAAALLDDQKRQYKEILDLLDEHYQGLYDPQLLKVA